MFKKYQLRYYNFRLLAYIIINSIIGVIVINSAKSQSFAIKQCIGIAAGLAVMFVISLIDYKFILRYAWLIYAGVIILLLIVKFAGKEVGGATRWIAISDSISVQPSEYTKIALILVSAKLISMFKDRLNTWKFLCALLCILGIPLALIVIEPDLSTTILICMVLFTIIYCAGLSYKIILIAAAIAIPAFVGMIIYIQNPDQTLLEDYQRKRIMAFIDPENYDDNVFQQKYSVQAIGSGQLNGKGLNNEDPTSVKNAGYILEPQTDFIFAVIGEELGFVGCIIILLFMALIIFECVLSAIRAKEFSARLICCGMAALITYQSFINIGVATQILPNTGLPLPFVSYGLSSVTSLLAGMGVVFNINLSKHEVKDENKLYF